MKSFPLCTVSLFVATQTAVSGFSLSSLPIASNRQQQHRLHQWYHSPRFTGLALSQENHSIQKQDYTQEQGSSIEVNRRTAFRRSVYTLVTAAQIVAGTAATTSSTTNYVWAFDGKGSSVSSGYNPATKAEQKKRYKERIAADVRDFLVLGKAIRAGETSGKEWVNFFITYQRREPDEVGRTYAALADLRGLPTKKANEFEGGDGLLLANTFTKAGKPPDNTPAVKSFLKLSKSFDAIEVAGKKGDPTKAKQAWEATSVLLSQYLSDVEMPSSLDDPLYKS
jgi:hypothetical protein